MPEVIEPSPGSEIELKPVSNDDRSSKYTNSSTTTTITVEDGGDVRSHGATQFPTSDSGSFDLHHEADRINEVRPCVGRSFGQVTDLAPVTSPGPTKVTL